MSVLCPTMGAIVALWLGLKMAISPTPAAERMLGQVTASLSHKLTVVDALWLNAVVAGQSQATPRRRTKIDALQLRTLTSSSPMGKQMLGPKIVLLTPRRRKTDMLLRRLSLARSLRS